MSLVSGDWVGLDLPARLAAQAPECRFAALGGATEASIWSNVFDVERIDPAWRSIPYGFPLRNQRFRVVDRLGRDCPDWVEGELWIGGAGLARGYRGDPEASAARFTDGWYRTGDLGRYWPDGTLEFLGRTDHQVKLRGYRIEFGEVEAALRDAEGVGRAVAAVVDGTLVAAVTAEALPPSAVVDGTEPDAREAAAFAAAIRGQAGAVAPLLRELLNGEITAEHEPTARLWRDWLARTGETPAAEDPAVRRAHELIARYRDILAGRTPAAVLLDEPLLAPAAVVTAHAGAALAPVADRIAKLSDELGRPVEVAEWGAAAGLADTLGERVRCTALDSPLDVVPAELRHRFDVVLANAVLHRYPDVTHGIAVARTLARPGGLIVAVEPAELAPIGLITAALLEHGFSGLDPARRAAGSPMLPARRWAELFAATGFTDVTYQAAGAEGLAVVHGTIPDGMPVLDGERLRSHARTRVPEHMVPERVETLPWLPLSANGKVDRTAVTRLLAAEAAPESGEPPRDEVEQMIAALWSELLGVPVTGREQSFFALGGDSLLATRFLQRVEQAHGVVLPLRRLFAGPTVARTAALFTEVGGAGMGDIEEGEL